jgi:hypothetical protein
MFYFDDNDQSIFNIGKKVLDNYGYAGNWSWIPDGSGMSIDSEGVTLDQLGWHISIHGGTRFPDLTETELRNHFEDARQQMLENGIHQLPTTTYPNGNIDDASLEVVKDYNVAARQGRAGDWPPMGDLFYGPRAPAVDNNSVSNIQGRIDRAANNNLPLILIFHTFGGGSGELSETDFDSVVSHADSANVDITTYDQFIKDFA